MILVFRSYGAPWLNQVVDTGPALGEGDDVSGKSFHDQTPVGKRNFPLPHH
jgi:hypothetical protein